MPLDPNRFITQGPIDYRRERQDARERLADLVGERSKAFNKRVEANRAMRQRELDRLNAEQQQRVADEAVNWGNDAARGAQMGSAFGPWGALIGGIAGSAKGMGEAFMQYDKEGVKPEDAIGSTFLPWDFTGKHGGGFKPHLPDFDSPQTSAAFDSLGTMYQGEMSRMPTQYDSDSLERNLRPRKDYRSGLYGPDLPPPRMGGAPPPPSSAAPSSTVPSALGLDYQGDTSGPYASDIMNDRRYDWRTMPRG